MSEKDAKPAVHLSIGAAAAVLIALQALVLHAKKVEKDVKAWADCALVSGVRVTYADSADAVKRALLETCERPAHASIREEKIVVRVTDWQDEDGREVRSITVDVQWRPAKVGIVRWTRTDHRRTYALTTGAAADADG